MPTNRDQESVRENAEETQTNEHSNEAVDGAAVDDSGDLDLEGLDLTVETVEERISPSETNVFDK